MRHYEHARFFLALCSVVIGCGGSGEPPDGSVDGGDGGENSPPEVDDVTRSIEIDEVLELTLEGTDADDDELTFVVVDEPAVGSLTGTPPDLTYTPPSGSDGTVVFTYQANDGIDDSNAGTYTIVIGSGNAEPVADDQSVVTDEDIPVPITVTGSDLEMSPLTFDIVDMPSDGSLGGSPPNVTYTPNLNFNGSDEFTFRVNDGAFDSATATVSITVNPLNDPPLVMGEMVNVAEGGVVSAPNLVANDSDPDDLTLSMITTPVSGPTYGMVTLLADGSFVYTHGGGESTEDNFEYQVCDDETPTAACATGLVMVAVTPVNDPPLAINDNFATVANTLLEVGIDVSSRAKVQVSGNVLDNDMDADLPGDSLTVTGTSGVSAGAVVTMNADGTFSYTPPAGFTGADTFQYDMTDGSASSSATVTVTVTGPVIWFIDNSVTGGANDGRSDAPFETLAAFNGSASPQVGDRVYIHTGAGAYSGPLNPLDGQTVTGEGVALSAGSLSLAAGTAPTIATSGGDGINLANDNTFEGFDIAASSNSGISGNGQGGLTSFDSVNVVLSGTGTAIELNGQADTFTFGNGSITGTTTGTGILVDNSSASITVSGSVTLDTGAAIAVDLNANSGVVTFSGGLDIDTTSGAGLDVAGGGTINVTGANNTIDTTTGRALRVVDSTIGASGLTFTSLSADGAPNGILLDNTGALGGLTVTGDGSLLNNGSGGTIQNTTADAIFLQDTQDVSLTALNITSPSTDGIDARRLGGSANLYRAGTITGVDGGSECIRIDNTDTNLGLLELDNSVLLGVEGTGDDGLWVRGRGTSVMRIDVLNGTHFNAIRDNAVNILAQDSSDVTVNIRNVRFSNDAGLSSGDSRVNFFSNGTAQLETNVEDSVMTGTQNGLNYDPNGSSSVVARILRNQFEGITSGRALLARSEQNTALMDFIIDDNDIDDTSSDGIVFEPRDATRLVNLSITNNRIGTATAVAEHGIRITPRSDRTVNGTCGGCVYDDVPVVVNALIDGNTVVNSDDSSETIDLDAQVDQPNGSSAARAVDFNVTVTNNTIRNLNNLGGEEVEIDSENGVDANPTGPSRICLDMSANSLESGSGVINDLDEDTGSTTDAVLDIAQADLAALASANGVLPGNIDEQGSPNYGAVASCTQPTHAP